MPHNFGTPEKRKLLRQHQQAFDEWSRDRDEYERKMHDLFIARLIHWSVERNYKREIPPFPEELRGLLCGAKNKTGTQCKQGVLFRNGRCKFHGGASTGPKTKKGKKKSAKNGFKPKAETRTP